MLLYTAQPKEKKEKSGNLAKSEEEKQLNEMEWQIPCPEVNRNFASEFKKSRIMPMVIRQRLD